MLLLLLVLLNNFCVLCFAEIFSLLQAMVDADIYTNRLKAIETLKTLKWPAVYRNWTGPTSLLWRVPLFMRATRVCDVWYCTLRLRGKHSGTSLQRVTFIVCFRKYWHIKQKGCLVQSCDVNALHGSLTCISWIYQVKSFCTRATSMEKEEQ